MPSLYKLGRRAVKRDTRTLLLRDYLTPALPSPPPSRDWTKEIKSFGMMLNDQLGDCTIAGCGHAVQIWTANIATEVTVPDSVVESYYEKWDGYIPGEPDTDNGGIELDVLNDWRQQGFDGHKIIGYADAEASNLSENRSGIDLFGGLYIGMNVPNFIMNDIPEVWDVDPSGDNGIAGGHCVFVPKYDFTSGNGSFTFVSWGQLYTMTEAFWKAFVDESHAILSEDWLKAGKIDPAGVAVDALETDLAAIR
jgi:hypothetical protein